MAPPRGAPVDDEDQDQENLLDLQFSETLSWRAGKPIATGELHRRLDTLSKELADLDQETTNKDSLTKVAKELVNHNLLAHKDKGVKAFAACCLVDVLRICAPHAPFTHTQLKDVFNLFITYIIPALQDPAHTYNNQHKYVLASLAEVQSIVLLNDIDNNEALVLLLFSSFFDGVSAPKSSSGERISKDVEHHMTNILINLIDEGANLPAKVVDVIMAQFLRAAAGRDKANAADVDESQSTLLLKDEPEAYQMAKTVCNAVPDKMSRFVAQYFSDVIMDFSGIAGQSNGRKGDDSDEEDAAAGPSEADLKELKKAHLLLRELWRAAPLVLQNVIPQLDAELSTDNVHLRQLATETLGDMIAGIGAAGPPPAPNMDPAAYPPLMLADDTSSNPTTNILRTPSSPHSFAQTHPTAYHNFVNRKNDKSAVVRTAWTTAVGYILSTSAGGIGLSREDESSLVQGLAEKLNDSDEKVRLAGVKAIECFSFKDVIAKLAPNGGVSKNGSVLGNLADRCRDRKPHVRVEAMVLLGKLWAAATGELAAGDEAVTSTLGPIPSRIINVFYANDLELNVLLDRVIHEYLVPLSYPLRPKKTSKAANGNSQTQAASLDQDAIRARRILLLIGSLDSTAKRAFFVLQARQPQFSGVIDNFLKQSELYNGGVMDDNAQKKTANLEKTILYLAQFFPDAVKVRADLHKFAKTNDHRAFQLVRYVIGREHDFKTMHRALKELVKRLHGSVMLDTLVPLLYRAGCIMFNRSHLSTILDCSRNGQDDLSATAHEVLNEISQRNPDLFKTHIGELCKDLVTQAPTEDKENEPIVVESLKACSSYSQKYPEEVPKDRKFTQTLISFALYGQPAKAAKYAINVMLAPKDDKSLLNATELFQKVAGDFKYDSPRFLNKLAAASQLELLAPTVTQDGDEDILKVVLEILSSVRTDASPKDPDWAEDAELDEECQVKILCLKFLVKRVLGLGEKDDSKKDAANLLRLLIKFVVREGEMCKTKDTPKHHKARLRLAAALSILKICTKKHCDDLLSPADFNRLAEVVQDPHPQVRRAFTEKLQKYLVQGKLRPRYYTFIFLAAFEPVPEIKQRIETWIRSRVRHFQDAKQNVIEGTMARLISLLAHHPDYSDEPDELVSHARYLVFYTTNVATEANLGLIYKYAERVKQTLDGLTPEKSDNLYVLSDLAQAILRKWQEKKNWTFEAYPGKVGMPIGLYKPLPSHEVAQQIAEKIYVPDSVDEKLDELLRVVDRKKKRKSMDERHEAPPAAKRTKQAKLPPQKEPKAAAPKKAAKAKQPPARSKKAATKSSRTPDAARRRSGRAKANQSYVERDSSEDEAEMLEGVAEWSDPESDEDDGEPMDEDEKAPESTANESDEEEVQQDEKQEEEVAAEEDEEVVEEDEADEEEEEESAPTPPPPPPPKSNGRKARPAPAKPKPKPKPAKPAAAAAAPKAKLPTRAAPAKPAAKATRGKAKKAKDVYDMDDDD